MSLDVQDHLKRNISSAKPAFSSNVKRRISAVKRRFFNVFDRFSKKFSRACIFLCLFIWCESTLLPNFVSGGPPGENRVLLHLGKFGPFLGTLRPSFGMKLSLESRSGAFYHQEFVRRYPCAQSGVQGCTGTFATGAHLDDF